LCSGILSAAGEVASAENTSLRNHIFKISIPFFSNVAGHATKFLLLLAAETRPLAHHILASLLHLFHLSPTKVTMSSPLPSVFLKPTATSGTTRIANPTLSSDATDKYALIVPMTAWQPPRECPAVVQVRDVPSSCGPPEMLSVWSYGGYYSPATCPYGYTTDCYRTDTDVYHWATFKAGQVVASCIPVCETPCLRTGASC